MNRKEYKNLVFDFNGTLVNDVDICFNILNEMLTLTGHPTVDMNTYLHIFTFPVYDYYLKAGFDLKGKDDFGKLADYFTGHYLHGFPSLKTYPEVIPTLKKYYGNKRLFILSATREDLLEKQVDILGISSYFDDIIGIRNIYASSKIKTAEEYFGTHPEIRMNETLFIGDTLHDDEVAKDLQADSVLVAKGHQAKDVLTKDPKHIVLDSLSDLDKIIA